ncbi:hypothetical protein L1049_023121 [Liquidambar formosana]|uniref:CCT domain-containing protein n=1 Tax=Liquidambar formosana TaxID=63359 RepID=A0AAP0RFL9_LIQFO
MASIPQFFSDYTFPSDFCEFTAPVVAGGNDGCAMWGGEESFLPFFDDGTLNVVPSESDVMSSVSMTSYSEQSQVSSTDMAVPTLPDFNNTVGLCGIAGVQNFVGGYQLPSQVCEFGEDCGGFVSDLQQFYPAAAGDNWGIQNNPIPVIEESNIKVGRYSVEERKERILRYLKKRNQRNFSKTIKYACRKTLADKRVRVRGRFARNNELCEEEMVMKKNSPQEVKQLYYSDAVQIKHDDQDWLQEAMESLMYLPYIAG